MAQAGRNRGITGIIDLVSPPTQLNVYITGFELALMASLTETTGPGDNFAKKYYSGNVGGGGEASGKVQSGQRPFPATMRNLQGTITHQADASCTITLPVIIESLTCDKSTEKEEQWNVEIKWTKNGPETITWNGTTVAYSQPSLTTKEINDGTSKTTDPSGLQAVSTVKTFLPIPAQGTNNSYSYFSEAAAVNGYLASAVPPITAGKVVNSALMRLDDAAGLLITQWALRSTADEATFPQTSETRSAMSPWTSSVAQIVTTDDTMENQATSLWGTFQSVANAMGLKLSPLTDGLRLAVYEYMNPGIIVEGSTSGGDRVVYARVNSGNIQLYIPQNCNKSYGSGQRKIWFSPYRLIQSPMRHFVIRRTIMGTVIPEQSPSTINGVTMPLIGQVNSSTFLGLAAGTVQYMGPWYATNIALSGTLPFFMGWRLRTDANGFFDGIPPNIFKEPQQIVTANTGAGWQNCTTFGFTDITQVSSASFAAFTA